MISQVTVSVTTVAAGTGSASTTVPVDGRVLAIHLDYHADAAAGTDVVITAEPKAQSILSVSNNKADGWYYPRVSVHKAADGTVLTYDDTHPVAEAPVMMGPITVTVAEAGAALSPAVTATILFEM